MDELIVKYINNELTHKEWQELRNWLEENDLNKTTLNNLKSFYSNTNHEVQELEAVVWKDIRNKLESTAPVVHKVPTTYQRCLKVAATLLLISAISIIAYEFGLNESEKSISIVNKKEKEAPLGSKIITKLPDGSQVTLNSGSWISYPDQFSGESRTVELSGEAFFEVKHNRDKPFYVKMNGDRVRVLGTSFNIRSYAEDSAVYVSVATGRVSYTIPSGEEVILEPSQMAVYTPALGTVATREVDKLQSFGWKDKIIYFKSATFDNMIIELERWYGVKIEVSGKFNDLGPFTGDFRNESLEHVLKGLSYVYPFNYEIKDKVVILNKIST